MTLWERREELLTSFAGAAQIATTILLGTVMAVYVGERGSPFAVGMIVTVYSFVIIIAAPVWGTIADMTGRRRVLLIATAGFATLSVLPLVIIRGVWGPIGIRGVYAAFTAGFLPIVLTIVSNRGGIEARGRSLGSFNSIRSMGFTVALLTAGVLLSYYTYQTIYLIIAAMSGVTVLAVIWISDPTPDPKQQPSFEELRRGIRKRLLPGIGEREVLMTNGLHWLYVALALRNASWKGLSSLLPVYLILNVGSSEMVMGVILALAPAAEIIGMYTFGRVADSVGRKPIIVGGVGAHAVVGFVVALATTPATLLVGQVVAAIGLLIKGTGYSALVAGSLAFIGDVSPVERESQLMGLRSTARGIGGVLGPMLIGGIATVFSFELSFVVAGGLAVVGMILVGLFTVESYPESQQADSGVPLLGN